eukprot:TRINITY_DN7253_c0_g1_i1.p1 TRINITY_DN7253_c0_g1~~TRINITY_DN7253_c0_g1_i1.p1  ORF type:complete len:799 (-),score=145.79 TRINITY_DN7253_c0_g1_i1:56-2284(-)
MPPQKRANSNSEDTQPLKRKARDTSVGVKASKTASKASKVRPANKPPSAFQCWAAIGLPSTGPEVAKDLNAIITPRQHHQPSILNAYHVEADELDTESCNTEENSHMVFIEDDNLEPEPSDKEEEVLLESPKQPKPRHRMISAWIWKFYTKVEENSFKCNLRPEGTGCHQDIVAGPGSNLRSHCRTKHPSVYEAMEHALKSGADIQSSATTLLKNWNPNSLPPGNLDRFVHLVTNKYEKTVKEITLLLWAINHSIAFHAFDSHFWKDFLACSGNSLLGSHSLVDAHLPAIYQIVVEILEQRILRADSAAAVTDAWDSNGPYGKVVCIVYHYILRDPTTGELCKHVDTLDYIPTPANHTGPLLASIIQSKVHTRLAPHALLSTVVTDGGTNFVSAAKRTSDSMRCISHTAQLVLEEVAKIAEVADEITNIHQCHLNIRRNGILSHHLRESQPVKRRLEPRVCGDTRWNATPDMIENHFELNPFLQDLAKNAFAKDLEDLLPTEEAIQRLRIWHEVAVQIVKFSTFAEGDGIVISRIAPYYSELIERFSKSTLQDSQLKIEIQIQARDLLKEKLGWILELQPVSIPLMASSIDPNTAALKFLEPKDRATVRDATIDEAETLLPQETIALPLLIPVNDKEDIRQGLKKFWKHCDETTFPKDNNPLKWWSSYRMGEPLLPIVQHLLAIPASSASAERAFSNSGFLSGRGRENINLVHLEQMAVIRSAMKDPQIVEKIFAKMEEKRV